MVKKSALNIVRSAAKRTDNEEIRNVRSGGGTKGVAHFFRVNVQDKSLE